MNHLLHRAAALALALAACGPARIDLEPASVQLHARGQRATVHATPRAASGEPRPRDACRWSSSDERIATVTGRHNEGEVTAAGHGRAVIRCEVGGVAAEAPVTVTLVARLAVAPARLELVLRDEPAPAALAVEALDAEGRPVAGRAAVTRCLDEAVCRGDARGQVWPVGAGTSRATVEVDGASAEVPVRVVDARSAAGRPRQVRVSPAERLAAPPARERR
ncbi:Ig-like domain-containing protein [Anaeromyxobacter diazotrophicus]|uniref:BIG2 domain-containing protein n=1 Tax=Anaeromyxobacter diazotrophicus TaxID=2590199 RepID=A0A7I9VI93_9BACT|nr:Ig-like domain-containing protein [Anaeromyxobacter diazotrophicus]GEJ56063.1 hypothetical protein AMYX_08040 [Anaeromyxobacter diazotrophicus]